MAAITAASTVWHNAGDNEIVTGVLSSVTDGDTWNTGLGQIDNVIISCNTLGTPISFGASWSGGTVTFDVSSNGKQLTVTAIGR